MDQNQQRHGNLLNVQSTSNFQFEEIEVGEFDFSFMNNNNNNNDSFSTTLPPIQKSEQFSMKLPVMQALEKSKITILTGNIAQILKWNNSLNDFQLFETIGVYASDWDSGNVYQRILLVRQPRGTVLKVKVISNRYPEVPHCIPGQFLRIIGRITDRNFMVAYKITRASEIDYQRLERAAQISERIFKHRTS